MSKKRFKKSDPFLEREAQKYEHPVPSREYILQKLEELNQPLSFSQFVEAFGLTTDNEQEGLRRRLIAMDRDGQLITNRRGCYCLIKSTELIAGRVETTREGYGFLIPDDGSDDIFLSSRQMRSVFHEDKVLIRVAGYDNRNRREGVVVEVLERNTLHIVGRFFEEKGVAFVDPDNKRITQDIIIPLDQTNGAKPGDFVSVEITAQPSDRHQPLGRVTEVLGDRMTSGLEVELALRSHDIPFLWSQPVLHEVEHFPKTVVPEDFENRENLCQLPFVTIDGEDARDFDDAVYCKAVKGGWVLYVAIADVSHYLRPQSALDQEALGRGNSVYFSKRVIPMLPEVLSNELCSLKPKVDRLVMFCEIKVSSQGKIQEYRFAPGVIHSQARLTYTEVAAMLEGAQTENSHVLPQMQEFHRLYQKLQKQRELRGAIEFETTETRVVFGDHGKIKRIVPVTRNVAHRMIEEAMLLANVCAAELLEEKNIPTLYRIHETPEVQKLQSLRDFLNAFGLKLPGGKNPEAKDFSKLLEKIQGRPEAHLLQTVMLRSLRQAVYSPKNAGHFGLSYERYCHFTSPIRRYPDVIVHRGIKHAIKNKSAKGFSYAVQDLAALGEHLSFTERRADEATRDALDWLKCEFMLDKVGQTFEGIISGVTGFGVFIELKDIYVEGLLHVSALKNDYYHFDAVHHLLRGRRSAKVYRLGDPITVVVARVNLDERKIDFDLVNGAGNGGGRANPKSKIKTKSKTKSGKKSRPRSKSRSGKR